MRTAKLNPHDERHVAVIAGVDPRTVRSRLAGRSQNSTVVSRIDAALRQLGFEPPPAAQPITDSAPPPRAA